MRTMRKPLPRFLPRVDRTVTLAGLLLISAVLSACASSTPEARDSAPSQEIERCRTTCLLQLCDPLIDLDPSEDPDELCQEFCQEQLDAAREQSCDQEYDQLTRCLEPLSCDEYMQWRDEEPGAACLAQEQEVEQACTQVEVPRL